VKLVKEPLTSYERKRLKPIRSPEDVANFMRERALRETVECFWVLVLDTRHRIRAVQEISRGTQTAALVHPREVYRCAVKLGATAVIGVHNHPSGDPSPSQEDKALTVKLRTAGEVLDITFVDHVIVADEGFYSFQMGEVVAK
jgi:DNA repair protein RadC